jgi:RNA polymerase sigma factor (sigma-70 family)
MEAALDSVLLCEFTTSGGEPVFRALVERHRDNVQSVALRFTQRHDLAEDVAQLVFIHLAKLNGVIPSGVSLNCWLYVQARSRAIDLMRVENARCRRENEFFEMDQSVKLDGFLLEQALESLSTNDREAILQRFYKKLSFVEVGRSFGLSGDAARMKVNRALEKLHAFLVCEGVTMGLADLLA